MVPISVIDKLEEFQCFLWGMSDGLRGLSLVSWDNVYRPHDEGGLGIQWLAFCNMHVLTIFDGSDSISDKDKISQAQV